MCSTTSRTRCYKTCLHSLSSRSSMTVWTPSAFDIAFNCLVGFLNPTWWRSSTFDNFWLAHELVPWEDTGRWFDVVRLPTRTVRSFAYTMNCTERVACLIWSIVVVLSWILRLSWMRKLKSISTFAASTFFSARPSVSNDRSIRWLICTLRCVLAGRIATTLVTY